MPWDFKFDPVSNDLIDDGKGAFTTTETAETLVMHQVMCRYKKCWHDEEMGSLLDDMQYLQPNPEQRADSEAKRCLGVLAKRGRIANVEVATDVQGPSRVDVATKFRDTSTGQVVTTGRTAGS